MSTDTPENDGAHFAGDSLLPDEVILRGADPPWHVWERKRGLEPRWRSARGAILTQSQAVAVVRYGWWKQARGAA